VKETRATQKKADQIHAILKAVRPGQEIDSELKRLSESDPDEFKTGACRFKPKNVEQCSSISFRFENHWLHRLHLAPRKMYAGQIVVSDGRLEAYSTGFGEAGRQIINTENRDYPYYWQVPSGNPVVKATDAYFYLTAATPDVDRAAALDWDTSFLTDLRRVENARQLLKSSLR
jgi:hypothetical protein